MNFFKKNFAIILAFTLPIILIIIVALSTYLPSLFISTNYNFLYAKCTNDNGYYRLNDCNDFLQRRYSVVNGRLIANSIDTNLDSNNDKILDINENYNIRFFLHDTKINEGREITFAEAQTLTLNNLLTSPDGVAITSHYDRNGGFFIFGGGSSSNDYYITKGGKSSRSKINLLSNGTTDYYQNNFHFIGWVMPGRVNND